jgi:integrase/recombinase XerD
MSQKITKQRKTRKLPKSVRPEEWEKLVEVIKKDKVALVGFLLAYGSGMRVSEVVKCKKEDFQSDGSILITDSKYGVDRKVPIPKGWREEFFKILPIKKTIRTLERKFKVYSKKAYLNPLYTFHSLRHGFATRLLESGTPISQVQLALGHSDISTTGIYIKASPQDLLKSYQENF